MMLIKVSNVPVQLDRTLVRNRVFNFVFELELNCQKVAMNCLTLKPVTNHIDVKMLCSPLDSIYI